MAEAAAGAQQWSRPPPSLPATPKLTRLGQWGRWLFKGGGPVGRAATALFDAAPTAMPWFDEMPQDDFERALFAKARELEAQLEVTTRKLHWQDIASIAGRESGVAQMSAARPLRRSGSGASRRNHRQTKPHLAAASRPPKAKLSQALQHSSGANSLFRSPNFWENPIAAFHVLRRLRNSEVTS